MLKVTKNKYINDEMAEVLITYSGLPITRTASEAGRRGMMERFPGRYGVKSMFIMADGYIFLCAYTPETYMAKMDPSLFLAVDSRKFYIRKSMVREICSKLTAKQHRILGEAKKNGSYINLSGRKKIKYYVFTTSGRIYGCQQIAGLTEPGE